MIERGMYDAIRAGRVRMQDLGIVQVTTQRLGAAGEQRRGSRDRPCQSDDTMTRTNQLLDYGRTDKAGGPSYKNAHDGMLTVMSCDRAAPSADDHPSSAALTRSGRNG